jgi:hypothetical protein
MRRSFVFMIALVAAVAARTTAQEAPPPSTVLTVQPAKEPVPALRYRLLPESVELIPGNAALFYHRAIEGLIRNGLQARIQTLKNQPAPSLALSDDQVNEWLAKPIDQLPRDQVQRILDTYHSVLREVEQGARRERCDWEFQRREEGFSLDIDEIQQTRWLARLVALQARLDAAEGRLDSAIHWVQTGLALARHLSQSSQFYIQSLVAASITELMASTIEALIQTPGCPNLYWALAALPRPFLDLTSATEAERHFLERELPRLRGIDENVWSLEQARAFGDELERKASMFLGRWSQVNSSLTRPSIDDLGQHLLIAGLIARAYPEAKRALIASGMASERVEAMPAIQVVAIYSYRNFEEKRDDLFKWANLPYSQGDRGMMEAEQKIFAGATIGVPFVMVLPGIRTMFNVPVRIDRRFAAIQTIEAFRAYAASHDGSPPPGLEALVQTPAPLDPAANARFSYSASGATISLTSSSPHNLDRDPRYAVRYQIKISR